MPVSTPHPEYIEALPTWELVRICIAGQAAVKKAGVMLLPQLAGQTPEEYAAYVARANYVNCTGRTHEAMLGFLFRKPPEDDLPAGIEMLTNDADLAGSPLFSYARQVTAAACGLGRAGTLVDYSDDEKRPYLSFYPALSIINWQTERVKGKQVLTLLVLAEVISRPNPADPFNPDTVTQYRSLRLQPATENGERIATCQIWETPKNATAGTAVRNLPGTGSAAMATAGAETITKEYTFTRRGIALNFIPFVFHGADNPGTGIGKSPLEDIANINVSHFQTSADLENALHICGVPTPYACGFGEGDTKLFLGSKYAWTTDNVEATCGFLEFTGQGVEPLHKAIEQKQAQMAAVGAGLIEPQKSTAESYDTVALRASAETSVLARIGMLVSETISLALQIADWWTGTAAELNQEIKFALNTDFASAAIQPEMLTGLIAAYQQGAISKKTLFHNLERGELYPNGWTYDEEETEIEANPPPMPEMNNPAPAGGKPKPGAKPPTAAK